MPADHHYGVDVRVPHPRRRGRPGGSEVTVADLMDRIREEETPRAVLGEHLGLRWEHEPDQSTVRLGHRADPSRTHVVPWIAGALASATVLSTSLVMSHVAGPEVPMDGGGSDSAVSDAGDHTQYTPSGVPAGPRIPGPRAAATGENPQHTGTADEALPSGATQRPAASARADGGAQRAAGGWSADAAGSDGGSRSGGVRDPVSAEGGLRGDHTVTSHAGANRCDTPGHILDLSNWKLTLPTGSGSSPTELVGNALGSLTGQNNWFSVGRGCAVAFRAPVNGVTTSGSKNPRSELREMTGDGTESAGWSSTSGTHTMVLREAFTRLPSGKPQVVGGQIHDASDDISVFRLEGSNLYVTDGNNPHYQLVTDAYVLGTPFEAKYVVSGGVIRAYYNGRLVATLVKNFSGAYFKAGAYTQANCRDASPCGSGNYGEVMVYSLRVAHS